MQERALFWDRGELGPLMAAHDWAATPVGAVDGWSETLRSTVNLLLRSRYPMILTWGGEYTQFYNDAYAGLIGDLHPAALGTDIRGTLAEGWTVLGPIIEEALRTGEASWIPALLLLLDRAGYREEAYFSVSHAAVTDDDGRTAGMFAVCSEVTEAVLGQRRLALLREVAAGVGESRTRAATCEGALAALARHPLDVPFATILLRDADGRLASATGPSGALPPELIAQALDGAPVDVPVPDEAGAVGGPWDDPVRTAVALPLEGTRWPLGVLVAGVSPNRALDAEHRSFFDLLAGQLAAGLRNAAAAEEEHARLEELAALDRAKTEFFANVSHEFRTPLTLLMGPLDDALGDTDAPLDPAHRERLELARRNARRLLKLVDGLLEFTRVGAGMSPRRRVLDLAQATRDVAAVFRSAVDRAGLRFTVDAPLPGPRAEVDPELWEQLVLNLVSNAFKFTFAGEIAVRVRAAGGDAVLEVEDTGIGIAAEHVPHLFERFHRVPGSEARTHEGTGIGLALVRDVARMHGGDVTLRSTPGEGTTFTVTLPASVSAAEAGAAPSSRAGMAAEEAESWAARPEPEEGAGDAPLVLVVDDNADMRFYLRRILGDRFRVRTAPDGEAALASIGDARPDVVVTDVMMPRMDGFALLDALRRDERTAEVPVLILSARSGTEETVDMLARGAADHMPKPFAAQELVARVGALASRAPAQPPRRQPTVRATSAPVPGDPEVGVHEGRLRVRIPADARHLGIARRALRDYLGERAVDRDVIQGLVLALNETLANAIEHAQAPAEPVVRVEAWLDEGAVRIDVRDTGRWLPRGPSRDRGRGSMIIEAVADIRIEPSPQGTRVSLRSKPA